MVARTEKITNSITESQAGSDVCHKVSVLYAVFFRSLWFADSSSNLNNNALHYLP